MQKIYPRFKFEGKNYIHQLKAKQTQEQPTGTSEKLFVPITNISQVKSYYLE